MSAGLATFLGLGLYALVLAPVIWAAFGSPPRTIWGICLALLLGIAVYNTGIFQRSSLTPANVIVRSTASTYDTQCQQILALAREYGLTIDRSNPDEPVITGNGVGQIPAEVRDVLIECSEPKTPSDGNDE